MELTANLIRNLTVELTDESGKQLGDCLLGTFHELRNSKKEGRSLVNYLLLPAGMLGKATRVTVTCHMTGYHVDPLSIELDAEGDARSVFLGGAETEGLLAIQLPESFPETGFGLNALSRPGQGWYSNLSEDDQVLIRPCKTEKISSLCRRTSETIKNLQICFT